MMAEKTNGSTASKKTVGTGMNKMDCVKKALETLGYEARPVDIRDHIKKNFNVEMTTDHISANKSTILKKRAKSKPAKMPMMGTPSKMTTKPASKKKVKRKPTPTVKVATPAAKVIMSAKIPAKTVGLSLEQEAMTVKGLVDRLGKDNLQTLIKFVTK